MGHGVHRILGTDCAAFLAGRSGACGDGDRTGMPSCRAALLIDGDVSVQRHGAWQRGILNQSLCARDAVRTGSLSRAAVMLVNEAVLRINQNSTIYLTDVATDEQEPSVLDLARGAFQSFSRRPRALEVNTPYLNAAVQGTEFVIRAEAGKTSLTVFEGTVGPAIGTARFPSAAVTRCGLRGVLRILSCWSGRAMPCSGDFITHRSWPFQAQA